MAGNSWHLPEDRHVPQRLGLVFQRRLPEWSVEHEHACWPIIILANDWTIEDPADVKCCMFTECRKGSSFGHCMNKAGNACSGGKWYTCVAPVSQNLVGSRY